MAEIRPLLSPAELMQSLKDKIRPGAPSFFELRAQLPSAGRSDLPIALMEGAVTTEASSVTWVWARALPFSTAPVCTMTCLALKMLPLKVE